MASSDASLTALLASKAVTSPPLTVLERPKWTMLRTFPDRLAALALVACGLILNHSVLAQGSFYSADFETGVWPSEFDLGAEVERLDIDGTGSGEFVPAWRIGTSSEANASGSFPVPNIPAGNRFAMANDDALPCDCDMADVALTLNAPSFVGRSNVALQCRIFHERILGAGAARIEVSLNGGAWIQLATVPELIGEWQDLNVDLSAFDGQDDVRIRFRWSDEGNWSSGFAVDDIELLERSTNDLAVTGVLIGDPSSDPFVGGDQLLAYSAIPLEQVAALTISTEIQNKGSQARSGITISTSIILDGATVFTQDSILDQDLIPGERRTIVFSTGWIPGEAGALSITSTASSVGTDEDPSNNTGNRNLLISGAGWDLGYGIMARDNGQELGTLGGEDAFIIGNRMELPVSGSVVRGVSAYITANSSLGQEVRGMLMDANLAFVDTSFRHALTQEDLDRAGVGLPIHLSFSGLAPLAAGDYFICIQHLDGEEEGSVFVGLAGSCPTGAAVNMFGENFTVEYLRSTPMVRMHLEDYALGISDQAVTEIISMQVFPTPMSEGGTLRFTLEQAGPISLRILDLQGRVEHEQDLGMLGSGEHTIGLNASGLAQGMHLLELQHSSMRSTVRLVVAR